MLRVALFMVFVLSQRITANGDSGGGNNTNESGELKAFIFYSFSYIWCFDYDMTTCSWQRGDIYMSASCNLLAQT